MPVMMTSSGECCLARESLVAPLFDFFSFWPGDLRGFIQWIVASGRDPRLRFGITHEDNAASGSQFFWQESEIPIVSGLDRQVSYGDMKKFEELTEREVLALAIGLEEEDERVYADFAEGLRQDYPATASMFDGMREEESGHRRRLLELFQKKFGEHIPLIRRQDVRGFVDRPALWLVRPLRIEAVRKEASTMEVETRRFYEKASARTQDASIRQLLDDLANEEREHENRAQELDKQKLPANVKADEEVAQRRLFVLQIVQPGLAGLMDGSVSTLAPVFAAAFATKNSHEAFLVGLAASAGAGISMGFAEALSDDGSLTGRGHPWVRGLICGAMTALGGIGHTLPFLLRDFRMALWAAGFVVVAELGVITWVRKRYMDTPWVSAALQVGLGGVLVFITGVLIGSY
jgi:erythrin-vacuolar iron transport family protein